MTTNLTPALYKGRAVEQQWMNTIYNTHDLFCGCPDPIEHLQKILHPKKQLCLPSTTTDGRDGEEDKDGDGFQEGDLEKLFEEPFTEEDDG